MVNNNTMAMRMMMMRIMTTMIMNLKVKNKGNSIVALFIY